MYVDIHAHIDNDAFSEGRDKKIAQWKEEGIEFILSNGVDHESNRDVKNLSDTHDIIYPAYGFHPIHVLDNERETIEDEILAIKNSDCLAIGEVGLDYQHATTEKEKQKQKDIFTKFIHASKQTGKPLIIHSRKAERDVLDLLENHDHTNAVLHCFFGKKSYMKEACDKGIWFSAPSISDRAQQLKDMTSYVPLRQLLTETDSPYLGPDKDEINTPVTVKRTVSYLAKKKDKDEETVKKQIRQNTETLLKPK